MPAFVAIYVSADGYYAIIGATGGTKEYYESWHNFFTWLKEYSLKVINWSLLIMSWHARIHYRCFSRSEILMPHGLFLSKRLRRSFTRKDVGGITDAESYPYLGRKKAVQKKDAVAAKLCEKLFVAAKKVEDSVDETLTYMDFPTEYWTCIRT